jgi:hypothetical protein
MLLFSQTKSFLWDEGFHILAAYLIGMGKRPYLDFFFPQTPMNAYWNAGWMAIFGSSWRVVHAVATLATIASVALMAQYLFALFRERRWQSAAAFAGLALFGLHPQVWIVGTISQAYPLCLLLLVAAFRIAVVAVRRPRFTMSALAGLFAGAGAASTLLTAPAALVLLIWTWLYNRAGDRRIKTAAFLAGAAVPCIPLLVLFAQGPHQVVFNILEYHTLYRRLWWPTATSHDIGVLTDWVSSSPSLLLVLLAVAGLFFIKNSGFDLPRRAEFRLCLWLALAIGAQNMLAHPTFPMYFVFMSPFLTVHGVLGFYAAVMRLDNLGSTRPAVMALLGVTALCLGNRIYGDNTSYTWPELEQVAAKVKQVTPKDGTLLAYEHIYFLDHWPVPVGMEHHDSHKLGLAPRENAELHIMPAAEVDEGTRAGAFSTTVVCEDEDQVRAIKEWKVYSQMDEVQDCVVFWQVENKNPHEF